MRMDITDLDAYVAKVLDLKKEYSRELEIHLGFEAEYYPALFGDLLGLLHGYPIEYFLLGQHFLGNEIGEPYSARPNGDDVLIRYCAQVTEAMKTGRFTYIAHPDLLNHQGDPAVYTDQMTALCHTAKQNGLPLEINLVGLAGHRHYPNPAFWEIAGKVGCDVILGSDAHLPHEVWNPSAIEAAESLVKQYGLNLLETVPLRSPLL